MNWATVLWLAAVVLLALYGAASLGEDIVRFVRRRRGRCAFCGREIAPGRMDSHLEWSHASRRAEWSNQ